MLTYPAAEAEARHFAPTRTGSRCDRQQQPLEMPLRVKLCLVYCHN